MSTKYSFALFLAGALLLLSLTPSRSDHTELEENNEKHDHSAKETTPITPSTEKPLPKGEKPPTEHKPPQEKPKPAPGNGKGLEEEKPPIALQPAHGLTKPRPPPKYKRPPHSKLLGTSEAHHEDGKGYEEEKPPHLEKPAPGLKPPRKHKPPM